MAGGEGAKERRRLKRLQVSNTDEEALEKVTNNSDSKAGGDDGTREKRGSNPRRNDHPTKQPPFSNRSKSNTNDKRIQSDTRNDDNNAKRRLSPHELSKRPKKKVKKPKHLKRKLERATEEDELTRDKLQKEMEEWERKKVVFASKKSPSSSKRQRTTNGLPSSQTICEERSNDTTKTNNRFQMVRSTTFDDGNSTTKDIGKKETRIKSDQSVKVSSVAEEYISDVGKPVYEVTTSSTKTESREPIVKNNATTRMDQENPQKEDISDEDSDDDQDNIRRRQRGQRRRGRKDTAKKIEEKKIAQNDESAYLKSKKNAGVGPSTDGFQKDGTKPSSEDDENDDKNGKDTTKKRYCIGRKPVTDFVLGKSYSGTVVYVKPFGVFFDIGCHSDAFCHVSRLCDDYVESAESLFKGGDHVAHIRVVEIDRNQKRITVSLQSEARLQDERASIEARKNRKDSRKAKSTGKKNRHTRPESLHNEKEPNEKHPLQQDETTVVVEQRTNVAKALSPRPDDPSLMTPADLKRARKLARRVARREQVQQPLQDI